MGHSSGERGQGKQGLFPGDMLPSILLLVCSLFCKSHVPSCFEHTCEEHPVQMKFLSRDSLIETLADGQADSIFNICAKLSDSKSIYVGTNFRITIINVHVHSVFVPHMPSWVIVMNNINILLA